MKKAFTFILIAGLAGMIYIHNTSTSTETYVKPVQEKVEKNDLDEIYNEADFKKQMELKARTVKATREKEAEVLRHKESIAKIEAELEAVRKEELTLGVSF